MLPARVRRKINEIVIIIPYLTGSDEGYIIYILI
jgi:hypothetical protein